MNSGGSDSNWEVCCLLSSQFFTFLFSTFFCPSFSTLLVFSSLRPCPFSSSLSSQFLSSMFIFFLLFTFSWYYKSIFGRTIARRFISLCVFKDLKLIALFSMEERKWMNFDFPLPRYSLKRHCSFSLWRGYSHGNRWCVWKWGCGILSSAGGHLTLEFGHKLLFMVYFFFYFGYKLFREWVRWIVLSVEK